MIFRSRSKRNEKLPEPRPGSPLPSAVHSPTRNCIGCQGSAACGFARAGDAKANRATTIKSILIPSPVHQLFRARSRTAGRSLRRNRHRPAGRPPRDRTRGNKAVRFEALPPGSWESSIYTDFGSPPRLNNSCEPGRLRYLAERHERRIQLPQDGR